ncbi:pyridoxal-phosphate dependent enzyme [Roseateles sp. SL47]|uniref:pyridoxal-phosphate dependent enzyme n=1 Tax=Roseateles sp. SL47 TaxID=2995138 RepID=UPI0022711947|nr:pyridoxal-phosphate dependent enzyme [Roseateles sp. SL47]
MHPPPHSPQASQAPEAPLHAATPLIESLSLGAGRSPRIHLKMEALQVPGSFKIRGVGHACQTYARRGAQRFITSSGGNAGLAVAYAGQQLGLPVLVVVPETTSERAKSLLALFGADVRVHGKTWQEANELAMQVLTPDAAFVHPFDDPLLWEGHASMIDEVVAAGLRPDAVVVAVGGGGLLSGVVAGLVRQGLGHIPVIAAETSGAASLHAAMAAGAPVTLPSIDSIATSLGAKRVAEHAWALTQTHDIRSARVSDAQAVTGCLRFLDDHRVLVEPACGAALAVVYDQPEQLTGFEHVLVIVCGGATATLAQLQQWGQAGRGA